MLLRGCWSWAFLQLLLICFPSYSTAAWKRGDMSEGLFKVVNWLLEAAWDTRACYKGSDDGQHYQSSSWCLGGSPGYWWATTTPGWKAPPMGWPIVPPWSTTVGKCLRIFEADIGKTSFDLKGNRGSSLYFLWVMTPASIQNKKGPNTSSPWLNFYHWLESVFLWSLRTIYLNCYPLKKCSLALLGWIEHTFKYQKKCTQILRHCSNLKWLLLSCLHLSWGSPSGLKR